MMRRSPSRVPAEDPEERKSEHQKPAPPLLLRWSITNIACDVTGLQKGALVRQLGHVESIGPDQTAEQT